MISTNFFYIFKSLKSKITLLTLCIIALIQCIDAIANSGFEKLYGNPNPAFISLLSNNTNIHYTLIFLWIMPVLLILSFANNCNNERKIGLKNIYCIKVKRHTYWGSKIIVSFLYSFVICIIPLMINLLLNHIFLHGGNYFFMMETYPEDVIGEYIFFSIRHPYLIYFGYILSTSLVIGLLGVFCQSVCFIVNDEKLPYIIVFAIWILYFSDTRFAIGDAFVPFRVESSLQSGLSSICSFLPTVVVSSVISYIVTVIKKDEI